MRQTLLSNNGAFIARVPRPQVAPGMILIRTHFSLISVGTETASLTPSIAMEQGRIEQLKAYGSLAQHYLSKSIRNPKLAYERGSQIIRNRIIRATRKPSPSTNNETILPPVAWKKLNAEVLTVEPGGPFLLRGCVDEHACLAITDPFPVKANQTVILDAQGSLENASLIIKLVSSDGDLITSHVLYPGAVDEPISLSCAGEGDVSVVIANAGESAEAALRLDTVDFRLSTPTTSHNRADMDQLGWNVGYSLSGEIVAVGHGVSGFDVGDQIACAGAGMANHADYVLVPKNLVTKLPQGCDLKLASTAAIGAIALQGIRRAEPQLGEIVAVLGLGLIGQITVRLLRAAGCTVLGFDPDRSRVERALQAGMDVGTSTSSEFSRLVRDRTNGHGVDITLVTAASKSSDVSNVAVEMTRRRGKVVLIGDVGLDFDRAPIYRRELDLLMSTSYGPGRYDASFEIHGRDYPYAYVRWTLTRNMRAYTEMIASGRIDLTNLIDEVRPLSDSPAVYESLVAGNEKPLAVIFRYDDVSDTDDVDGNTITLQGHKKTHEGLINFALVGAGAFGQSMLVPLMQSNKDLFFFQGVASQDAVRGGNFARAHRVKLFASDIAGVLEHQDIDLVVIATRHHLHADQVVAGLRAGKNVFVEKPLAINWDQFERVLAQFHNEESTNPLLMVGYNRRFSPPMQLLKSQLAARSGPIIAVYRVNAGFIPQDHWVQTEEGGGRNIGEACHFYDCFRYLTGNEVASVTASAINPDQTSYGKNDNFSATITYEDGSVCTLIYTAMGPKTGVSKEYLEVFCDGKSWCLDDYKALSLAGENTPLWQSDTTDKGHAQEIRVLGEAIKKAGPPPIPTGELFETSALALHIEDLLMGRA